MHDWRRKWCVHELGAPHAVRQKVALCPRMTRSREPACRKITPLATRA